MIFYMRNKPIKRSENHSMVKMASYRSGYELTDYRTGNSYEYPDPERVVSNHLLLPDHVEAEMTLEEFANKIEQAEIEHSTRPDDARLGRRIPVALPHEISQEKREELLNGFVREQFQERFGIPANVSYHEPHEGTNDYRNHHGHVLVTERAMNADGTFAENKERILTKKSWYQEFRQDWADHVNEFLHEHGIDERIYAHGETPELPARMHRGPEDTYGDGHSIVEEWNQAVDQLQELYEAPLDPEQKREIHEIADQMDSISSGEKTKKRVHEMAAAIAALSHKYEHEILQEPTPEAGVQIEGPEDEAGSFKKNLVEQYYDQDSDQIPDKIQYMNAKTGTMVLESGATIRHQILEDGTQEITVSDGSDRQAVEFLLREFDARQTHRLELFGTDEFKQHAVERYEVLFEQGEIGEMELFDRDTGEALYAHQYEQEEAEYDFGL